jgi:hypothetical protein
MFHQPRGKEPRQRTFIFIFSSEKFGHPAQIGGGTAGAQSTKKHIFFLILERV